MGMRLEKLELRIYEETYAEILAERMAEKSLAEKHRVGKAYRHRKPEKRNAHGERYSMRCGKINCGNSTARNYHAEKSIRKDWVLEQAEAEIDAALEWAHKQAYLRNLNEWLRWA